MNTLTFITRRAFYLSITVALLAVFPSCKKEDEKPQPSCRITKEDSDLTSENKYDYEYDGAGLLKTVVAYEESNVIQRYAFGKYEYEYNQQQKLIKTKFIHYNEADAIFDTSTAYEYDEKGRWRKTTVINNSGQITEAQEATYSGDKITIKRTFSNSYNDYQEVLEYSGENLIKSTNSDGVTTYEYYSDKENKMEPVIKLRLLASKNLLKTSVRTSLSSIYAITDNYTYEFNEKGYVTKSVKENDSGNTHYSTTTTYEYECQ
jgi:hypothetical protein